MKKEEIVNSVTKAFYKMKFFVRKNSPEILVMAGIVGGVIGAVVACKETRKMDDILDEAKADIDYIHETPEDEIDKPKELTRVYVRTGLKVVRLYAPAATIGAVSITSILAGNDILRKRNVAVAAAYATVDAAFKEYRGRVVDRFGEDVDREIRYNVEKVKVEDTVVDEETGKTKKVKNEIEVADANPKGYVFYFDNKNCNWDRHPGYNLSFLDAELRYANDLLQLKGYLFLNDVLDMLDIPRTRQGQAVGWWYDPNDPTLSNHVSFGLNKIDHKKRESIDNGFEDAILLDFNVDGMILNRLSGS